MTSQLAPIQAVIHEVIRSLLTAPSLISARLGFTAGTGWDPVSPFRFMLFRILTNALFLGHWSGNPRFHEAAAACLGITLGRNKYIFASTVTYSQWTRSQKDLISQI